MSRPVIKVENLSKQYRLGQVGTGTISHDLNRWWHRIRGKEDPYLRVGETNDRSEKGNNNYVWALRDISFEVQQGEVLGIIGKNGAGKSTLLKILSKVTGPTTGSIKARGRIASLLEVGTGFHPELTGRENIFLNGTILGMTKREVARKLDEIVDFAGVARYLDTPVKRYSSGMMVRLGFAVAAHLEPEILIVDEVLAVGDAEFQRKAIGKMQEVSKGGGRTVLFVSHNMAAVQALCGRGIHLYQGQIQTIGDVDAVVDEYSNILSIASNARIVEQNGYTLEYFRINGSDQAEVEIKTGDKVKIEGKIIGSYIEGAQVLLISFNNTFDERILLMSSRLNGVKTQGFENCFQFRIDTGSINLMPNTYHITVRILNGATGDNIVSFKSHLQLKVVPSDDFLPLALPDHRARGYVYASSSWEIKEL